MTKAEKIVILQQKGDALLSYFDGKPLPIGTFKLNKCTTVWDANKFHEAQVEIMKHHYANPYSTTFINAYLRLQELKKYMDELR
jgi:hypothetical protein